MFLFNSKYFIRFILLFLVEIGIALFFHDKFIRPYLGDVLVVILIYCFIQSFFNFKPLPIAIGVLLFSFTIEFAQYYKIVRLLGLQKNKLANVIIGNSFAVEDLWCYVVGICIVLLFERKHFYFIFTK